MHVFLQLDRPVDYELVSRAPLLPVLYLVPVGTARDPDLTLDQSGNPSDGGWEPGDLARGDGA